VERSNLNISQYLWWVERDSILIAYFDASAGKFTSPVVDQVVTIFYIQRPDKFLVSGETPERDGFESGDTYLEVELSAADPPLMTDTEMLNQECEIPEQFHEALVARVIADGYERKPETIKLASHFLNKYEHGVRQCRKYAYRGRDGSQTAIQTQDF